MYRHACIYVYVNKVRLTLWSIVGGYVSSSENLWSLSSCISQCYQSLGELTSTANASLSYLRLKKQWGTILCHSTLFTLAKTGAVIIQVVSNLPLVFGNSWCSQSLWLGCWSHWASFNEQNSTSNYTHPCVLMRECKNFRKIGDPIHIHVWK